MAKPKSLQEPWKPVDGPRALSNAIECALAQSNLSFFEQDSIAQSVETYLEKEGAKVVDARGTVISPDLAYRLMRVCAMRVNEENGVEDAIAANYRLNALSELRKEMEKAVNGSS